MIAISSMAVLCLSAKFPIQIIGKNDKNGGRNDQPDYISSKKVFYCQHGHAQNEQKQRGKLMMMFFIPMP